MFIKTMAILKNNPLLVIMLLVVFVLLLASTMLIMPDLASLTGIYSNMSEYSTYPPEMDMQTAVEMLMISMKIGLFSLLYGIVGLFFSAGYGNMLAAAVNEGKASLKVFLYGIRKFTGKVFLSALLLAAIIFGFSFVISIISTPFIMAGAIGGVINNDTYNFEAMMNTQKVMQIVMFVIMIFLYPLIIMWFPAIFLDREEGVMACFRNGFRAGVRKYIKLVPLIALLMLPTLLIYLFSANIFEILNETYFYTIYLYQAIVLPVAITILFIQYQEVKKDSKSFANL